MSEPLSLARQLVLELNGPVTVDDAVALQRKNSDVLYAEPDYRGRGGAAPNDPSYPLEWHHQKFNPKRPGQFLPAATI